jgi:GNAT superfamily N-acetyltransferase
MIAFKQFDIATATNDEWNSLHEYRRKYHFEDSPKDPMVTDQAFEESIKGQMLYMGIQPFVYGVFDNDQMIGMFFFGFFKEESPSYVGNEKMSMFTIELLKKYRQQGIGSFALKILAETCEKYNKSIFSCNSNLPEVKKFYDAIGAKIVQSQVENRLSFSDIDWSMINDWIQEGEQTNRDSKIQIINGKIPDDIVLEFIKSFNESAKDQPRDDSSMGDMILTIDELRKMEETEKSAGIKSLFALTIEKNGEISGFSNLKILPGREKLLSQGLTGVPKRFRGRKLGKWVKANLLLFVKENFPESESIVTGNAESNAPMLYINNKLGFKKYKEQVMAQVYLENIKQYLHSKPITSYPIITTEVLNA